MADLDEPVDPELAGLYAADRARPLPTGAGARVLAAALTSIAAGTVASSTASAATVGAAGATTGATTKAVVAIALAAAAGGGVVGAVLHAALRPTPPAAPLVAPAPPRDVVTPPDAAPAPPPPPVPVVPLVADAAPAPRHVVDAAPPADDDREPLLIDQARAALRRGLTDDAIATLMRHERLHRHGDLAEARDVLLIEAYLAQGNLPLARRRLARYRDEYPAGYLRARVDALAARLGPP